MEGKLSNITSLRRKFFSMQTSMRTFSHQFKIFYTIIGRIVVKMMDYFINSKQSAQMFFHYQNMFQYISLFRFMRMIFYFDVNYSSGANKFSTFPSTMFFKCPPTFFSLIPCSFSPTRNSSTLPSTISGQFSIRAITRNKLFLTNLAFKFLGSVSHKYSIADIFNNVKLARLE